MKRLLCSVFTFLIFLNAVAQKALPSVSVITQGTNTHLRGLSVVNDNVVWAAGSKGMIGRSLNGGKDWKWSSIKGYENREFRDIEAFDGYTAVIIAIGEPAHILRTIDGGTTWKLVYENNTKGMFLDAIEFWNINAGIVIGDPIDNKFFIARTFDGGQTWKEIPDQYKPVADSGEACFAASGTNVRALDNDEAIFVSGGTSSNVFIRDQKIKIPIIQGKETTGANSVAVWDRYKRDGGDRIVIVGGDFAKDTADVMNVAYSHDRGVTWKNPKTPTGGYRSCVEFLAKDVLITCGLNGVDYSTDGGKNWQAISKEGFHTVRIARTGRTVYLAGANGKIGKLVFPERK